MITTTEAIRKRRAKTSEMAKVVGKLRQPVRSAEDEKLINDLIERKFTLERRVAELEEYAKALAAQKQDLQDKNWKLNLLYEATHEIKQELKSALRNLTTSFH